MNEEPEAVMPSACRCGHTGTGEHPCHGRGYTCRKPATRRLYSPGLSALAGVQMKVTVDETWACDGCWAEQAPAPRKLSSAFYEWARSMPDPGTGVLAIPSTCLLCDKPPAKMGAMYCEGCEPRQAPACSTCGGGREVIDRGEGAHEGIDRAIPCPSCGAGRGS